MFKYSVDSTAEFDDGTKDNTKTVTDEYGHNADSLNLSFPYSATDANLVSYYRYENNAMDETETNDATLFGVPFTRN